MGVIVSTCVSIPPIKGIENLILLPSSRVYMEVTPSILTADFCKLGETLDEAIEAGLNWIHMDVMDGNWVINKTITFGPAIIRSVRDRLGEDLSLIHISEPTRPY